MPFSSNSGKSLVDRAVIRFVKQYYSIFSNRSIVDIGAGSGTYSDRYSKTWLSRNKFKWTGIEIWEPYLEKYNLKNKYDNIIVQDALEHFNDDVYYDICFMGDVVEHVSKEDAIKLVDLSLEKCNVTIISIPIGHYPQDEYDGNPHEKHIKDDWSVQEVLESFQHIQFYGVDQEIGVFICSKDDNVKKLLEPQIGVYAICKDELKFIDRFYDSIKDADQIVICDTGSTDGTFERLQEIVSHTPDDLLISKISYKTVGINSNNFKLQQIFVSPWRFDDARNNALMLLPEEIDVCISIDVDELLEDNWKEILSSKIKEDLQKTGKVSDRYYHRFKTIWNWLESEQDPHVSLNISEHWHERIHSRKGYMWKLPVHEVLVKTDLSSEQITYLPEFMMIQKPDTSKPRSSYLSMLEISVIEDPTIWKSWSFLAGEHQAIGQLDKAIKDIETAKKIKDSDVAFLCYQASVVYQHMKNYNKAILELLTSVELLPHVREYHVYLAKLYLECNMDGQAHEMIKLAKNITQRTYGYEYNPDCWGNSFEAFVKLNS